MQQIATATDAGGLRLDQGQDHLDGDRGVDGAAAPAQDVAANLRCQRMRRYHHLRVADDHIAAGGRLGRRQLFRGAAGEQHGACKNQQGAPESAWIVQGHALS